MSTLFFGSNYGACNHSHPGHAPELFTKAILCDSDNHVTYTFKVTAGQRTGRVYCNDQSSNNILDLFTFKNLEQMREYYRKLLSHGLVRTF